MAFWIDIVTLAVFGLLFPYLFAPSKYDEKIEKELKRLLKYFSFIIAVVYWYEAGFLYLNLWSFDVVDNLFIAFFTAIPAALAIVFLLYLFSQDSAAFHWSVFGIIFILVFIIGWLLVPIVTFIGMVLGAIVTGFTRFRSTWSWSWGGDKFGFTPEQLAKYGQTYFMWNGWLNIFGIELVSADKVISRVENPLAMGNLPYTLAAIFIFFVVYPLIPYLCAHLTWNHIKKFS